MGMLTSEDRERIARQISTALGSRVIEDDFDRGWQKAIDRVATFLTEDLADE